MNDIEITLNGTQLFYISAVVVFVFGFLLVVFAPGRPERRRREPLYLHRDRYEYREYDLTEEDASHRGCWMVVFVLIIILSVAALSMSGG